MKVYLAAGFSRKDEIKAKTIELQELGVHVTSQWPWEPVGPKTKLRDVSEDFLRENGTRDLQEIDQADALVLFTQDPETPFCRGGRMHEAGYAQGRGKTLIICGPRENIFHFVPGVAICKDFEEVKALLVGCLRA